MNFRLFIRNLPQIIADLLVTLTGVWSLFSIASVYLKVTFTSFFSWAWVPLLISIGLIFFFIRKNLSIAAEDPAGTTKLPDLHTPKLLIPLILFVITCLLGIEWYIFHLTYWAFWVAAIIYLASLLHSTRSIDFIADNPDTAISGWANKITFVVVICLAIFVTLITNRPDADDANYLNSLMTTLDHPNLPMLSFDGMLGDIHAPITAAYYKPQTEPILQAVIVKATGISATSLYYIVFPAFFAAFIVIAQWLFIRSFSTSVTWLGLILVFVLLLAWGESHRSYGNFSFVRLFQGKGILIFFFTPLIIYYARMFSYAPSWPSWLLLMFAEISAVSFSSSALVTIPITAGVAILSMTKPSREGFANTLKGLLASAPLVAILIMVYLEQKGYIGGIPANKSSISNEILNFSKMLEGSLVPKEALDVTTTFGDSWRAPIALCTMLALPLVAHANKLTSAAWATRYILLIYILLLNNFTAPFLAEHVTKNFAWRLYWAIPTPTLVAVALSIGVILAIRSWQQKNKHIIAVTILTASAASLFSFLVAGKWTLSSIPGSQVTFQWATPKVNALQYRIAQYVVKNTPKGSTALVIYPIAGNVARFHNAPELIAPRAQYMTSFRRYWGENEYRQRLLLAGYVSGKIPNGDDIAKITPWVLNQIDRRGIKCVVTFMKLSNFPPLHRGLIKMGFVPRQALPYVIWLRP